MDTLKKWSTSMVAIVLSFWLFFPLGFVLLYIRLKDKHGKYYSITKILYWTGIVWSALGLFYVFASIGEKTFVKEYLPAGLFVFIIPGIICFYFGFKRNKKMKVYDKYMAYINTRRKSKIDGICNSVGVDYETGLRMVEEMINKGFINGYIEDDELIIKNAKQNTSDFVEEREEKKETKVVKCKECGAKNTVVVGQTKECEYCGTLLQ